MVCIITRTVLLKVHLSGPIRYAQTDRQHLNGRLNKQKITIQNHWCTYKPSKTNWKWTSCRWQETCKTRCVMHAHGDTYSLFLAYFWCLPMPSLVVCESVEVDKVSLGLWAGWAEHQTVLPPLHLLNLNKLTTEIHWGCRRGGGKKVTHFSCISKKGHQIHVNTGV